MNKELWCEIRENIIEKRLGRLEEKQGRPATKEQEESVENSVTEDDITDSYSGMVDYTYEMHKDDN